MTFAICYPSSEKFLHTSDAYPFTNVRSQEVVAMEKWTLEETNGELRLAPVRALGLDRFTWAHLLYSRLGSVQVYVVYFPSRFDLAVDTTVIDTIRTFGTNTGPSTSVNVWDTRDPHFGKALELFDIKSPPALVFATGLQLTDIDPRGPDKVNFYTITITNMDVLSSADKLPRSINIAHDILVRGNPKEITLHVHTNALHSLLQTIAKVARVASDEIIKLKPKFQLPDGSSIQLGG